MQRFRRARRSLLLALAVLLLLPLLAACGDGSGPASPARATSTPLPLSGDTLMIDGAEVRRVLVPDPAAGPAYAVTDAWLYINRGNGWQRTETTADDRWLLADAADRERIFRGDHAPCTDDSAITTTTNATPASTTTRKPPLSRSNDGGDTWVDLPQGAGVQPLAIDPTIPNVLYGTTCQLVITENAGGRWVSIDVPNDPPIVTLLIERERLLQLERAADGYSQLREVDVTLPSEPLLGDVLLELADATCLDAHAQRVIVGGGDQVYISDDGGRSWARSTVEPEPLATPTSASGEDDGNPATTAIASPETTRALQPMQVLALRIDIANPHRIYAGTSEGLYLSQDDGATWVRYNEVPSTFAIRQIDIAAGGADLYLTSDTNVLIVTAP